MSYSSEDKGNTMCMTTFNLCVQQVPLLSYWFRYVPRFLNFRSCLCASSLPSALVKTTTAKLFRGFYGTSTLRQRLLREPTSWLAQGWRSIRHPLSRVSPFHQYPSLSPCNDATTTNFHDELFSLSESCRALPSIEHTMMICIPRKAKVLWDEIR